MTLSEFFDYLAYSGLSQYAVGTGNNGAIAESDYPKVAAHTNMALTAMHTDMDLKMDQLLIEANSFQSRYVLSSQFAHSNTTNPEVPKYILDSVVPFTDDLLSIVEVIHEDDTEFPLNDSGCENTVYTPNYRTLQFNQPVDGLVAVLYRANHQKIPVSLSLEPKDIELDIPQFLVQPLVTYVTSCIVGSGGNAESTQEGMMLMAKYTQQVETIKNSGVLQVNMPTTDRFRREKWV